MDQLIERYKTASGEAALQGDGSGGDHSRMVSNSSLALGP
jgi:hypothetical protein